MAKVVTVKCKKCDGPTRVDMQLGRSKCVWCKAEVDTQCRVLKSSSRCEKCNREIGDALCELCSTGQVADKSVKKIARNKKQVDYIKKAILVGPYISWGQFNQDILDFSDSVKGKGYDAVIGVPRSGMVVATQMSIRLGIPLYSLCEYGPIYLGGGLRVRERSKDVPHPKNALLVEDSTATGRSFREATEWMGDTIEKWNVKKAVVYCTGNQISNVDEYYRELDLPHWFEWNLLWNRVIMGKTKVGVDFDGILCPDFTKEQDDDGWRYIDALKKAKCLVPAGTHIYAIITARLEKYRPWTEDWLRKHEITYDNLIMGQWDNLDQRKSSCVASYKAKQCKELKVGMFIESCPNQSEIIKSKWPYPVLCPDLGGSSCG